MKTKVMIWDYDKPRNDGTYPLKIRVRVNNTPRYLHVHHILISDFDEKTQRVKPKRNNCDLINGKIANALFELEKIYLENKTFSADQIIEKYLKPDAIISDIELLPFIEHFIKRCESGEIKRASGTIQTYRSANTSLIEFNRQYPITFNSVNKDFYLKYTHFMRLERKVDGKLMKYSTNTIGKHIKVLKVFLNEALENGITDNKEHLKKYFKTISEEVDNIYLSENDLSKIANLNLINNKRLEQIRDLFLIGAYTGLRFSDFSTLKKEYIKGNYLTLKQAKTGGEVVIPLKKIILDIIAKYGTLPVISNQKMNEYLKEICKMDELKEIMNVSIIKNGASVKKYDLVTTHTARRSFATNAFLAGVPPISIMRITGHKTERSFMKYIKITNQQNAEELVNHPFFG